MSPYSMLLSRLVFRRHRNTTPLARAFARKLFSSMNVFIPPLLLKYQSRMHAGHGPIISRIYEPEIPNKTLNSLQMKPLNLGPILACQ